MMARRQQPLVVIASATPGVAEEVAARLRVDGAVAYPTHSAEGCLRVATSVRPDVVLIDPTLGKWHWLLELLRAHPVSAQAQVEPITAQVFQAAEVERTAPLAAA